MPVGREVFACDCALLRTIAVDSWNELVGEHLEDFEADDFHARSRRELIAHRSSIAPYSRSHGPTFSPASREMSARADTGPLNVDVAATIQSEG